jgi:hypothetical protein
MALATQGRDALTRLGSGTGELHPRIIDQTGPPRPPRIYRPPPDDQALAAAIWLIGTFV